MCLRKIIFSCLACLKKLVPICSKNYVDEIMKPPTYNKMNA